ncbi:MAG TPA: hypothetical protein VFG69_08060 [Nannocystaceae bacterium]|nr:hypothetical protein [Nannocystaceae bacterium]
MIVVLALGCASDDDDAGEPATTSSGGESSGTALPGDASSGGGSGEGSSSTGMGEVGELRIEILDPLPGAEIMAAPTVEPPGYFAAFYDVRAALRGEGGEDIAQLVAQSSGPFGGYYYADLVDGPDGRVATFGGMIIGGLHMAGDPPTQFGVRVTPDLGMVPPPAEVIVTVIVPAM